ncbi:YdhK family protein [Rummeliibacillus pycnus]|uniref:YdhK family protein n=1 Tax=Rummeliibacillus pycnus TaxID=101070 RepID=UPI001FE320C0|nr:YdhK family protein [Rummeliibacillus pycnus]
MKKNVLMVILSFVAVFALVACGTTNTGKNEVNRNVNVAPDDTMNTAPNTTPAPSPTAPDHTLTNDNTDTDINHSNTGIVPNGVKKATNPTYPVGSQVTINANHVEGMNGAKATIVGAYDTIAYAVTYTPTTGGAVVKNHKWVIQEEIRSADNKTLQPGAKVTLEADHLPGMKGAMATIDSGKKTTVYMVNYTPTNGGAEVKNHKWLIESELSPVK